MLIDVHCHCNLYLDLEEVIKEAKKAGVNKIISVGMSALGIERVIQISEKFSQLYPALGIHPEEVKINKNIENQLDSIIDYIRSKKELLCAIGEIGLDHYFVKQKELYPLQKRIFEKMLFLAQELALPVNLHTKGAEKLVFDALENYKLPNVDIHWYSGPEIYLKAGIERGYYFSITPAIKYSPPMKKVVQSVDIEHLLLESDGPVEYSGKIGTPAMIREVLNLISKIKGISVTSLEDQILENTMRIFPKIF